MIDSATTSLTIEEYRANVKMPSDFGWHGRPEDHELWCKGTISRHRDSELTDISNYETALKIMRERHGETEGDNWRDEQHGHWAVGWVDTITCKVAHQEPEEGAKRVEVTDEFATLLELKHKIEEYPLLDEEDHSQRELDAWWEILSQECPGVEGVEHSEVINAVAEEFSEKFPDDMYSDGNGGWPEEGHMSIILTSLGYQYTMEWEEWYDKSKFGRCCHCGKECVIHEHPNQGKLHPDAELPPRIPDGWTSEEYAFYGCKKRALCCPECPEDSIGEYLDAVETWDR